MTKLKSTSTILFVILFFKVYGQNFERTYTGQWAMTFWKFEFRDDGTYKRTSTGHYGNPTFEGQYNIYNDTIELEGGYESSSGTLNKYYLISSYHSKFTTKKQGRIIDLTNLYEYYNNNYNYPSQKNKIVKVVLTDSLNNFIKSFTSYVPVDHSSSRYQIDLSWCVEFYNFPPNLRGAHFEEPDKLDKTDGLFKNNIFNTNLMLSEYTYVDSSIAEIEPLSMKLEYFKDSKKVKKITDSQNGSIFEFDYGLYGSIKSIIHYNNDGNLVSKLNILD